jgi:hypothetical protein
MMETPFILEAMTIDELVAHHGDAISNIVYTINAEWPHTLHVHIQDKGIAWTGTYSVFQGRWYLTKVIGDAGVAYTQKSDITHVVDIIRKVEG